MATPASGKQDCPAATSPRRTTATAPAEVCRRRGRRRAKAKTNADIYLCLFLEALVNGPCKSSVTEPPFPTWREGDAVKADRGPRGPDDRIISCSYLSACGWPACRGEPAARGCVCRWHEKCHVQAQSQSVRGKSRRARPPGRRRASGCAEAARSAAARTAYRGQRVGPSPRIPEDRGSTTPLGRQQETKEVPCLFRSARESRPPGRRRGRDRREQQTQPWFGGSAVYPLLWHDG